MNFRLKELPAAKATLAAPTPEDLALIAGDAFAGAPVAEGDLHTGEMRLAHDSWDRTGERFTKAILERFAATLPGRSLLPGHDYRQLPLGRFYRAEVASRTEEFPVLIREKAVETIPGFAPTKTKVAWLHAGYYFPSGPATEGLARSIAVGVLKDVSIGFSFDSLTCDLCRKDYLGGGCGHILMTRSEEGALCTGTYGGDVARYEAQEGSIVWLGAQQQAELGKSLADGRVDPERYASTVGGLDLVRLKAGEALARRYGHAQKSWAFPCLQPPYDGTQRGKPMFEFEDETALLASEPVTKALAAAAEGAQAKAEEAKAAAAERDALRPLADIGKTALTDLTAAYVGHVIRLEGDEGEAKAVAELFTAKGDYAGLRERVEKKWAEVCKRYPAGTSGDPNSRGPGGDPPPAPRDPIPPAAYLA